MTAVVVGASAGLGRALAVALAAQGQDVLLIASDARDLEPLGSHLALTYGVEARVLALDALDTEGLVTALARALEGAEHIEALFAPIGVSRENDDMVLTPVSAKALLDINFLAVLAAVQTTLPYLRKAPAARIVGFGSIATIRGRGRNIAYSAAKRALASYFESLRQGLTGDRITVQFYQMGYIDTQQLHGQRTALPSISPEKAASIILADGNRDFGERYLPQFWWPIAIVLRNLPWFIFKKLNF